ncbi:hypothetical protein QJQ45_014675, partial [Haematococcus lacustris]
VYVFVHVLHPAAITATGIIWSRYATVITPINYNLMAVNVFMAITGSYQLYRKFIITAATWMLVLDVANPDGSPSARKGTRAPSRQLPRELQVGIATGREEGLSWLDVSRRRRQSCAAAGKIDWQP